MRKQLVVYANETKAVVMNKSGQYKEFDGTTKREVALKALAYAYSRVPELTEDSYRIIVADKSFLQQVSYVQNLRYYLINGKTKGGEQFTPEEITALKELNEARKNSYLTYVSVITEKQLKREEKDSWKQWHLAVDTIKEPTANKPAKQTSSPVSTVNPVVAKLQELMTKALEEGDFDKYDQLEARLNKLQPAQEQATEDEVEEVEVPVEQHSEDWIETDEEDL